MKEFRRPINGDTALVKLRNLADCSNSQSAAFRFRNGIFRNNVFLCDTEGIGSGFDFQTHRTVFVSVPFNICHQIVENSLKFSWIHGPLKISAGIERELA